MKEEAARWSWSRAFAPLSRDLALFAVMVAVFLLLRGLFVLVFHRSLGPAATLGEAAAAFWVGFRSDTRVSILFLTPSLLASLACLRRPAVRISDRVRIVVAGVFFALTLPVAAVDLGYFAEFHAQFDSFVLGAVYDDFGAVAQTVWKEYPILTLGAAWLATTAGAVWAASRGLSRVGCPEARLGALPVWAKVLVTLLAVTGAFGAYRGSLGRRPLQAKDLGVCSDPFLNQVVANPYDALRYAVVGHLALQGGDGILRFLHDGDVRAAARRVLGEAAAGDDLDAMFRREAPGWDRPPRHVFLVVMESYSAWPLLPRYRGLGIAAEMVALGERGVSWPRFLSSGSGTMTSFAAILTGLPEVGVMTNWQPSSRAPYATSLPAIFRRLGYRTRLFCPTYLSWQRVGEFARDQGFDEVVGGAEMGAGALAGKEWGVDDEVLFDFVAHHVPEETRSFNVLLTASNHPPFEVDLEAHRCPLTAVPPDLAALWDGSADLRSLGHFWYTDRCAGEFVRTVEKALPDAVFGFTGDHYGRRFLNAHPTLYERKAVPFVLYGPSVLGGRAGSQAGGGSHVDIGPTLIELAAPRGFGYAAFGRNLLADASPGVGFGVESAITADALVEFTDPPGVDGAGRSLSAEEVGALRRRHLDLSGLVWWRIRNGSRLPGR